MTATAEQIHGALDLVLRHAPEALSAEGRRIHAAEVDRIRERDERHNAGVRANEQALRACVHPTKGKLA